MNEVDFDRVVAEDRSMSIDEFLTLPMDVRVRIILERRLAFFKGDRPVDLSLALQQLRRLRVSTVPRSGP